MYYLCTVQIWDGIMQNSIGNCQRCVHCVWTVQALDLIPPTPLGTTGRWDRQWRERPNPEHWRPAWHRQHAEHGTNLLKVSCVTWKTLKEMKLWQVASRVMSPDVPLISWHQWHNSILLQIWDVWNMSSFKRSRHCLPQKGAPHMWRLPTQSLELLGILAARHCWG